MSSEELADFWVHAVTVKTYLSTTGAGVKRYAAPVTVTCFLSRKQRFVRAANGDQVPSSASLSADLDWAATLAVQSIVTLDGRDTTIIAETVPSGGDFITGIDRARVFLQ